MSSIISTVSRSVSGSLSFGTSGSVANMAMFCVCAKSETAAAADLIFYVILSSTWAYNQEWPTESRVGPHPLALQKRIIIMALKSIRTANESLLPCCGAFWAFRICPHITIKCISSYNKFLTGFSQIHILEQLSEDLLQIR